MKDVAKVAGVHQTTVSLALRNHPSLPKGTRTRIQEIARKMGYRPDPMLANLAAYRRRSRTPVNAPSIGYIMDLAGPEALRQSPPRQLFLNHARGRAEELGYRLEVFYYAPAFYQSRTLDRTLRTRNIEGLILGAFWDSRTDLELTWEHYSVIKIEMLPFNLPFDVVQNNQMQATRLAMEKAREMGYRRVGMAIGQHDEDHTRNLFSAGYFVGQTIFDPEDRIPILVFDGKHLEKDAEEVGQWVRAHRVEVIVSNWHELDPVIEWINRTVGCAVRRIPLDVDRNDDESAGIVQNHEEVGRYAVEQLTGLMRIHKHGPVGHPTVHLIDSFWQSGNPGVSGAMADSVGSSG